MKTSDFNYDLPEELIANYPLDNRSSSRLLVYTNKIEHKTFKDVLNYFEAGDLLVVNNTSVIPARVYGNKESGGSVEVMLERVMQDNKALVQIRSGRSPKIGTVIILDSYKPKTCSICSINSFAATLVFSSNRYEVTSVPRLGLKSLSFNLVKTKFFTDCFIASSFFNTTMSLVTGCLVKLKLRSLNDLETLPKNSLLKDLLLAIEPRYCDIIA